MNRADVARILSVKNNLSLEEAELAVETFFNSLLSALSAGKKIEIRGFGTFQVREYAGYLGRNPKTGEPVSVPPKRLPHFRAGKNTKEMVDVGI